MLMGFPEPKLGHWADHSLRSWDNVRNAIRERQGMSGEIETGGEGKRDRKQKVRERERQRHKDVSPPFRSWFSCQFGKT